MVTKMNHMVIRSLHKQIDQIAIQQNENENVVEEKLMLLNDVAQFHIPKII
jgi:acetolactate synthase small subunit